MSDHQYAFDDLPLDPIDGGNTVLLAGPKHGGGKELGLRMLVGDEEEGVIIVTTDERAASVMDDCEAVGMEFGTDRMAIVECLEGDEEPVPARVLRVSSAEDLTGIGMRYSKMYQEYHTEGVESVRTGLFSVSTVLSLTDLKTVSRFVHTLAGRVSKVGGLGVFRIDPAMHDDQAVRTISQFCDGRIDVRNGENGAELRARGVGESGGWHSF